MFRTIDVSESIVDGINDDMTDSSDNDFSEFELDDIVETNQPIEDKCIIDKHIISVVNKRFEFNPKDKQIDAIRTLVNEKRDTLFIARTGYGKSIVFQATPLMYPETKTALIIMPLKLLEEEQCDKLSRGKDCKPFVLNGDTNNPVNIKLIRQGTFTHSK